MHPVIRFRSKLFDPAVEPKNPINPIPGASILEWLRQRLSPYELSEPIPEDWGWCSHLRSDERTYMIGACLNPEADGNHECLVQVDKSRTLIERLTRRSNLNDQDPVFTRLLEILRNEPGFTELFVERGP